MTTETPSWVRDAVFYQIFPDRFARGGRLNAGLEFEDWDAPPTVHGFKGGDLYGICDRLPYLQDLGITALYLNPVFSSASNHRYHTYDYFQVDPLLGGNAALRNLLDEAHQRQMKVVLDGVFNHAGRGFWQFHHVLENGQASPFRDWFYFDPQRMNGTKPFLPYPDVTAQAALTNRMNSLEAVGYAAWWNLPALPKFNVHTPAVREFLLSVAEYWIDFGIDGWRLDVPNEIDDDTFWQEFRRRVRAINPEAYIVGEVWGEAVRWLHGDMWDAVMNYQVTAACLGFFGGNQLNREEVHRLTSFQHVGKLSAEAFAAELVRIESLYPAQINECQLNLLDSHDMPRFLTCASGDITALQMAWLLICTLPGAPCVYYGDEVGLDGGNDPDCRKAFPRDSADWNHQLLRWYRQCLALRSAHPALRHGTRRILMAADDVLVTWHQCTGDSVIVIFNCAQQERDVVLTDSEVIALSEQWVRWPENEVLRRPAASTPLSLVVGARTATVLCVQQS